MLYLCRILRNTLDCSHFSSLWLFYSLCFFHNKHHVQPAGSWTCDWLSPVIRVKISLELEIIWCFNSWKIFELKSMLELHHWSSSVYCLHFILTWILLVHVFARANSKPVSAFPLFQFFCLPLDFNVKEMQLTMVTM